MADSDWRTRARPIIAAVIAEHKGKSLATIRAHLRAAYPFGEYHYHPHKMWLRECREQLLAECVPPGFVEADAYDPTGRRVMADWWLLNGDEEKAKFLNRYKHKHPRDEKFSAAERNRIERLYAEAMAGK